MNYLIINIERYISARAQLTRRHIEKRYSCFRRFLQLFCFCSSRHHGNYLVIVYFLVKLMWLVNTLAQLFLLNAFLGNDYYLFGFEVLEKLFKNQRWTENRHFPKVTYWWVKRPSTDLCIPWLLASDFKIREIGINHFYTVQCVLRINLFNEVIFIIQWFWLISVSVGRVSPANFLFFSIRSSSFLFPLATVYDFLLWLYQCTVPRKCTLDTGGDGKTRMRMFQVKRFISSNDIWASCPRTIPKKNVKWLANSFCTTWKTMACLSHVCSPWTAVIWSSLKSSISSGSDTKPLLFSIRHLPQNVPIRMNSISISARKERM